MNKWDAHSNYIGYLNGVPQRRVYVSIEINENRSGRNRLSIHGQAGDGSAGQIDMHIKPSDITPAKGLTNAQITTLWSIWERWHLNDMQAGCEHQRAHADARGLSPYQAWEVGEACPVCEYRYGHEWIYEHIPSDVLDWLKDNFTVKSLTS